MKRIYKIEEKSHVIAHGGYVHLVYNCKYKWLYRFIPVFEKLFRPEAKHEPESFMIMKPNGIYQLSFEEYNNKN